MSEHAVPPERHRDFWVSLGLSVSALAALVSSFSGLRSLALLAGWVPVLAFLLPVTIDAYAMTATRVWLAESTRSQRARRFARSNAIGAILLSLAGNATDHLIASGLLRVTWLIVLCVGAVPPVVLGLVSHLAVLRQQTDGPRPSAVPAAVPGAAPAGPSQTGSGTPTPVSLTPTPEPTAQLKQATRYDTEDELLTAARAIDAAWRAAHNGRPVSRDTLRAELHIGAARATAVLRQLRTKATDGSPKPSAAGVELTPAQPG